MLKKLLFLFIVIAFSVSVSYAGPRITKEQISKLQSLSCSIKVVGDAIIGVANNPVHLGIKFATPSKTGSSTYGFDPVPAGWITSITRVQVNTDVDGMYDLCSNGTGHTLAMNPASGMLHYVHMFDPLGDDVATAPNRRTKYYVSTDKGSTWEFKTNVPDIRSGYGCVDFTPDGIEMIASHTADGVASAMGQVYIDASEGLGVFSRLQPNLGGGLKIWPRIIGTDNISNTNKVIMLASINSTTYDSAFYTKATSLSGTGTWTPWTPFNAGGAEVYQIARGDGNKIGIAYIAENTNTTNYIGDIMFMESTDDGATFSSPVTIWDCKMGVDSMGGLRGIDICYLGGSACVTFELAKVSQTGYYPGFPSKIMFWSNALPGSDPNRCVVVSDSSQVGYRPAYNTNTSSNDVLIPMCRPSIGRSGGVLFIAYMVPFGGNLPSGEVYVGGSADTCSFNAVWLAVSGNGGASWKRSQMVTPYDTTTTMKDWTWPNLSKFNDSLVTGGVTTYYANLTMLADSIPGSYYAHVGNGEARSRVYFTRVAVAGPVVINTISSEIPGSYSLNQNYPNPFNPTTTIRFALPKTSSVTLKVYNVSGQLVKTLISNETVTAGTQEVKFNGENLSSGIYFYSIEAGNYKETKKMMLIK